LDAKKNIYINRDRKYITVSCFLFVSESNKGKIWTEHDKRKIY